MGWIHNRHMRQGGSIGPGGLGERKKGAPLRRIVRIVRDSGTIFGPNRVEFECGHEGEAWGGVRGRCVICKKEAGQ